VDPDALNRIEAELIPLVPRAWACPLAREHARSFNESVSELREAVLAPARDLAGRGAPSRDLAECLERTVAELAFWRRVLAGLHGDAFEPASGRDDYLLWYLTSR